MFPRSVCLYLAQILEHDEPELNQLMRDFARGTADDIVLANYDTDKRSKIPEKMGQFFPSNLELLDQAVRQWADPHALC